MRERAVAFAVLAGAVAIAFGPALGGVILSWDDGRFLVDDPAVGPLSWARLARMFTTTWAEAYHPLHRLANAIDRTVFGRAAVGAHATSLVLWTAALVAVHALFRRLGAGAAAAIAGAVVVGLHPLQAEPVAWLSGKKDVLAMLFFASAATAALGADRLRSRATLLALALHAAALLSKTSVVVLPVFLFLADWLVRGRDVRESLARAAPYAALSAAAGIPVLFIWSGAAMIPPAPATGLTGRIAWVGHAIAHHLEAIVWPARLSVLYPTDRAPRLDLRAVLGLAALAASVASVLLPRLGRARLGTAWIGLSLLPVANVVPLVFFAADRYASLTLLGPGWLLALAVDRAARLPRGRPAALAAAALLCVALVPVTRARAAAFQSDETLFRAAVRAQPRSYFARVKYGEVLRERRDLPGAVAEYRAAIALDPERPVAHGGLFLAVARLEARREDRDPRIADRALAAYLRGFDDPQALARLSRALRDEHLPDAALLPLDRSLSLEPWPDAHLRAEAARALQAGERKVALLLLRRIRDPDAPVREALRRLQGR